MKGNKETEPSVIGVESAKILIYERYNKRHQEKCLILHSKDSTILLHIFLSVLPFVNFLSEAPLDYALNETCKIFLGKPSPKHAAHF